MIDNERMIQEQVVARGVRDERVLEALRSVPRELFVPPGLRSEAFDDNPLPLQCGQTISQPYIVAYMTARLGLSGCERVLEIGTGSGYQTAILSRLARQVYTAEIQPELAATVLRRLASLHIENVVLRLGNGIEAFRDLAPFDAILSAAAPAMMPERLLEQLADGGRAILPVGDSVQHLWLVERQGAGWMRRQLEPVRFVPLREKV
jgi:protein-L-isoaspartate(D-aspartate) O-methyltransferase